MNEIHRCKTDKNSISEQLIFCHQNMCMSFLLVFVEGKHL